MDNNVIEYVIKAVDQASGPLAKVNKTIGSSIKIAAGMAAGVAAAAVGVVGFTFKVSQADDKVAKFAYRLGLSVSELSAYHFVASQSGVATEQFDLALQRANRRVAEAAQGTGEAKDALRELGINAGQFANLGLDQQMETLADKFEGVRNQGDKLRLAFKLFDSEGVSMLQILGKGSAEMQKLAERAAYLGLVISKQAAANAETFDDKLSELTGSIKGVARGIAGELQPILSGLFVKATDAIAGSRGTIVAFVKEAIVQVTTFGIVLGQVFAKLRQASKDLFTKEGFQNFVDNALIAMGWVIDLFVKSAPILGAALISVFKLVWQTFFELGKWGIQKVFDFFTRQDLAGTLSDVLFERIPEATKETREMVSLMMDDLGTIMWEKGKEASGAIKDAFGVNVEAAREQAQSAIESIKLFGKVSEEENAKATTRSKDFMDELKQVHEDFMTQQGTMAHQLASGIYDVMLDTAAGIGDAFAAVAVDGASLLRSLEDIGRQALKAVISMLVRMGIQRLIISNIVKASISQETSAALGSGIAQVYTNSFASAAAIPLYGWAIAPGVATANAATASAGAAASMAAGSALGGAVGQAHSGLTNVPGDGTYVLKRNERVLAPEQNKDLTEFLSGGGGGGGLRVDQINIYLPNANIKDMSPSDIREALLTKIYPAMDKLARGGIYPRMSSRKRNR